MPARKALLLAGDIGVCLAALSLALVIRHGGHPGPEIIQLYLFSSPFLIVFWIGGLTMFGLYDLRTAKNEPRFFDRLLQAILFDFIFTVLLFYFIPVGLRPITTLAIIFAILVTLMTAWRGAYNVILSQRVKERVLFYGATAEIQELSQFISENPQLGFTVAGYFLQENEPETLHTSQKVFQREELSEVVKKERVTSIIVAHTIQQTQDLARSLFKTLPLGVMISDFPRFYESIHGKIPVSLINEAWFIENLIGQKRPRYEFAKRITDVLLVIGFGIIALILLPFIALLVMLSTPRDILNFRARRARAGDGIIFFRQTRIGKNGTPFRFVKFRSQILGAEHMGYEKSIIGDKRGYPVGTLLRKTYLDELPQLWNVLLGHMSFVGPRPERPEFVEELEKNTPFYRMRELVLPGITGWAQINMKNDASVSDAPEKLQYDLFYIKNRSIVFDLSILLRTTMKLLQRSGR